MSEEHPTWMTGHIAEVQEIKRREVEKKLAEQQTREQAAHEQAVKEAEFKAAAAKANSFADQMAQDTYKRLVQFSSEPDAALTVTFRWKFSIYRYFKIRVSSENKSHEVSLGRAWTVREPMPYTLGDSDDSRTYAVPGLWLDENGQLRTAAFTEAYWGSEYAYYGDGYQTPHYKGTKPEGIPELSIDDAYPKAIWGGSTPVKPLNLGSWVTGGTYTFGWPFQGAHSPKSLRRLRTRGTTCWHESL
jgi:hypothetical protein